MKPFNELNKLDKARMLHDLFSEQAPFFLEFLEEFVSEIIEGRIIPAGYEKDTLHKQLIKHSKIILRIIERYPQKDKYNKRHEFSFLFSRASLYITIMAMERFIKCDNYKDLEFHTLAQLLFKQGF